MLSVDAGIENWVVLLWAPPDYSPSEDLSLWFRSLHIASVATRRADSSEDILSTRAEIHRFGSHGAALQRQTVKFRSFPRDLRHILVPLNMSIQASSRLIICT